MMHFNDHHNLEGLHAFMGASKHSWLRYDDDHMADMFRSSLAAQRGTELHALAADLNKHRVALPKTHLTLNDFVNDGLHYRMSPEVVLYFSPNCFGTADLIGYDDKKKLLRIFDLKTGSGEVKHFDQLYIYTSLFCLEYKVKPMNLQFDLRLYQNDHIKIATNADPKYIKLGPNADIYEEVSPDEIAHIMDRIQHFDQLINKLRAEESEQW